jgi:hypothetical protein
MIEGAVRSLHPTPALRAKTALHADFQIGAQTQRPVAKRDGLDSEIGRHVFAILDSPSMVLGIIAQDNGPALGWKFRQAPTQAR